MDQTNIKTLYVFVEIAIDTIHLAQTVRLNFPDDRRTFHETLLDSEEIDRDIAAGADIGHLRHLRIEGPPMTSASDAQGASDDRSTRAHPIEPTRLALVSTIQFVAALQRLKDELNAEYSGAPPLGLPEGGTPDVKDHRSRWGMFGCPSFGLGSMKPPYPGPSPFLPVRSSVAPHPGWAMSMLSCEIITTPIPVVDITTDLASLNQISWRRPLPLGSYHDR